MTGLFRVFYQPGELFSSLPDRRRAWIVPLLVNCLLGCALWAVEVHFIGFVNIVRQQLSTMHMSADTMDRALQQANTPLRLNLAYVQTAIGVMLATLLIAGILKGFSMMTAHSPRFASMLSMVALAQFPYYLVVFVMTALILSISPDPTSLSVRNLIATNPAAYMNKDTMSSGLYSVLESIDLLSFAELSLLAYGFGKITRAGFFAGVAAVGGMWILYVSCKMALSVLF